MIYLNKNRPGWNHNANTFQWEGNWVMPEPGLPYAHAFLVTENKYGLPHNLLARQAQQESYYNPTATSPAGAQGLMQIIPEWHPGVDPFDPFDAIDYAGQYMRENYNRFGSWKKALAAYNWGPTALSKAIKQHGPVWESHLPNETAKYIRDIGKDVNLTA